MLHAQLQKQFSNIDVYLFDQLLKGRFDTCSSVLDVGCGSGRNIAYLSSCGIDVYGVDSSQEALDKATELTQGRGTFCCAPADKLPFTPAQFDAVICNAVLHFAQNEGHFTAMLDELHRVLVPGGLLFIRLASSIGIEELLTPLGDSRYILPDGSTRYVVTEAELLEHTKRLDALLLDPLKTTNVQNQRCMTTWVMQKAQLP